MKKYSQFLESLSVLVIFVLLTQLAGCRSTWIISESDLVNLNTEKYSYIIHTPDSKYMLNNASISSDTIYGRITKKDYVVLGNKVRLYLPADSLLKVNTYSLIAIPLDNIVKAEDVKLSPTKNIVLTAIGIPVVIIIGILIQFCIGMGD